MQQIAEGVRHPETDAQPGGIGGKSEYEKAHAGVDTVIFADGAAAGHGRQQGADLVQQGAVLRLLGGVETVEQGPEQGFLRAGPVRPEDDAVFPQAYDLFVLLLEQVVQGRGIAAGRARADRGIFALFLAEGLERVAGERDETGPRGLGAYDAFDDGMHFQDGAFPARDEALALRAFLSVEIVQPDPLQGGVFVQEALFALEPEDQVAVQKGLTFRQVLEHLRLPAVQKGQQGTGVSVVRILQQFPVEGVEGCRGLRAGACIVLSVNAQHIRRLIPEHVREQFLFPPPCRRDGHLARLAFTVAQVADRSQAAVFSDDQGKGDLRAARCRACVHGRFFVEEAVFAFKLEDQAATQQGLTFGQAVEHLRPPVIQKGQQRLGVSVRAGIETLMMQRQKGLSFFRGGAGIVTSVDAEDVGGLVPQEVGGDIARSADRRRYETAQRLAFAVAQVMHAFQAAVFADDQGKVDGFGAHAFGRHAGLGILRHAFVKTVQFCQIHRVSLFQRATSMIPCSRRGR